MNTITAVIGFLLVLAGIGYLYRPDKISKLNSWFKNYIFNDRVLLLHRRKVGVAILLIGVVIFYLSIIR